MSNNKICNFLTFTVTQMRKKPTTKRAYVTMESAMTEILRDASGKMHHGILFNRRLESLTKLWTLGLVWTWTLDLVFFMISHTYSVT